MNPLSGNNLSLWKLDAVEGLIETACARNCTLQVNQALKEVTNYESNNWQEFKPDLQSWSMQVDGLVANQEYSYWKMLRDQKTRAKFFFQFIVDEGAGGFYVVSGYAFITNFTMAGPQKDVATYQMSLQGTGSYSITDTPIPPSGGDMTYRTSYQATGGETSFVVPALINCNALLYASRGGIDSTDIITSGTPTGGEFKINIPTGTIYIDVSNPAVPGEWFNFLYR
jgi:predicted secreted protein